MNIHKNLYFTVVKLLREKIYILPAVKKFGCKHFLITCTSILCDFTGILYHKPLYLQHCNNTTILMNEAKLSHFCCKISESIADLYILQLKSKSYILSCICTLWSINFCPCRLKQNKWINWAITIDTYLASSTMSSNCLATSKTRQIYFNFLQLWANCKRMSNDLILEMCARIVNLTLLTIKHILLTK